eukprot:gnl/Dysnectes_brevis/2038_a2353_1450.p1 GENE.gnl/Dysnectes_brevis/2038_a2353_1450~~gnl/Dysnectes_brevis/2038_a2353_1450.p1  ORF type:complete len:368 (-),score=140.82 gnl/Dysnectes_brevis/2038_a2353_1450:136-1239(-)
MKKQEAYEDEMAILQDWFSEHRELRSSLVDLYSNLAHSQPATLSEEAVLQLSAPSDSMMSSSLFRPSERISEEEEKQIAALRGRRRRGKTIGKSFAIASAEQDHHEVTQSQSPDFQPQEHDPQTQAMLLKALNSCPLTSATSTSIREHLASLLRPGGIPAGGTLIRQGEQGDCFYILESGHLKVLRYEEGEEAPGREVNEVTPGAFVGELALINHAARAATVVADVGCRFFKMQSHVYRAVVRNDTRKNIERFEAWLSTVPLLSPLSPGEVYGLAAACKEHAYPAGGTIIRQGAVGDCFFLLLAGEVVVEVDGAEVNRLGEKSYFGEAALITRNPRNASIIAVGSVKVATVEGTASTSWRAGTSSVE